MNDFYDGIEDHYGKAITPGSILRDVEYEKWQGIVMPVTKEKLQEKNYLPLNVILVRVEVTDDGKTCDKNQWITKPDVKKYYYVAVQEELKKTSLTPAITYMKDLWK